MVTEIVDKEQKTSVVRRRRRQNKKQMVFAAIVIVVFGAVLWGLVSGLRSLIFGQIAQVPVLNEGVTTETQTIKGLLIKQEHLVTTPYKGTIKFSVPDGYRIKGGTTFATVTAPNMGNATGTTDYAIKAPASGVLSRQVDGLETVLVPDTLDVVKIQTLDKIERNQPPPTGIADKGQPVAKIIDNLTTLYVYATLNAQELKEIRGQKQPVIDMAWQNQAIEGRVEKTFSGKESAVILAIDNYPDELLSHRWVDFRLTTEKVAGLLLPKAALVKQDGQTGIFQVWKGIVHWVPVQVTGSLKDQVVIKGKDIQPGIRYVVNPTLAREGDRL